MRQRLLILGVAMLAGCAANTPEGSTCPAGPSDQRQTGEGQPGADCCVGQLWAGRRGAETTGVCPCVGAGWFADIQHRQHNIETISLPAPILTPGDIAATMTAFEGSIRQSPRLLRL